MKGLFLDAGDTLAAVFDVVARPGDASVTVRQGDVDIADLPRLLAGYDFVLDDHTALPTEMMRQCPGLRHVIFLGTGARSYMNPDELAALGITVHLIRGYGDTAVAEHTVALIWAAARGLARMDRGIRAGEWFRTDGVQLTGKTIGLIGYGGIAAEVARITRGMGMRVLAWNRSPRQAEGVAFVGLDTLLAQSDVVSLHLLLTDETRGFLSAERLASMKEGAILVNTARGALVDEADMVAALRSGKLAHAALDVFTQEPLPAGHVLTTLENVTLSAHSAFRTPEASQTLIRRAMDIATELAAR
jgi:D-3-phosphoglycerate dehydrogenase